MGQPVTVIEKPSTRPGVIRYETNRTLTGMGHEYFRSAADVHGTTPPARLAQRLLERGGIDLVHMNGNVVTVHLSDGSAPTGIKALIEDLYTYYRDGVEPEIPGGPVIPEGAAPE
jgi:hypothetical protein